jgi:hypothetical protein
MRAGSRIAAFAVLFALAVGPAEAKKFRYEGGPPVPDDTTYATATTEGEPVVRTRGPKVPPTNFEVISAVSDVAFDRAMRNCPVDSGGRVLLAPSESHPLNFMVEHALLQHLAKRGVAVQVRRSIVPDDSVAALAAAGDPLLEYQLATARITYLRLRGWLPGRVKIERQGLVEGTLTMRDPGSAVVLWSGKASYNLVDAFPKGKLSFVEDARFGELKAPVPGRSVDKALEPIVVIAIVAGLIALFFQNRP